MEIKKIVVILLLVAIFFSIISIGIGIVMENNKSIEENNLEQGLINQGKIQIIIEKDVKNESG